MNLKRHTVVLSDDEGYWLKAQSYYTKFGAKRVAARAEEETGQRHTVISPKKDED